jgi:endonuclease VIII
MPEGDTIYRAARTLQLALAGRVVTSFKTVLPALKRVDDDRPVAGRTVNAVRAAGKHLLIEFSGNLVLRTHMRMNGSWHVYRPGERWQRARSGMRIVVATAEYEAVAFDVPVAEFLAAADVERHAELRALGPDLLGDRFDRDEAVGRLRERADMAIADALLDQRMAAGVGNVFKSEILFVCRLDPFRTVSSLTDAEIQRVVDKSRELLKANVIDTVRAGTPTWGGSRRTTGRMDPGARLWVYGRGRKPCRVCGTPIEYRKQGRDARGTYWCPSCQL